MSNVDDFYRIDDCDKINSDCINAFVDFKLDPDSPTGICLDTSWGGECLDLTDVVKSAETCTTFYLSPDTDPNCLVYEPECGDNICIHGDDISRIISLTKLKDVDQNTPPTTGDIYMYDGEKFVPFNLQTFIDNYNSTLSNLNATINNILNKLTPPDGAPLDANIAWSNINLYSDPEVEISESTGEVVSLDKSHGIYSHPLSQNKYGDEIFG